MRFRLLPYNIYGNCRDIRLSISSRMMSTSSTIREGKIRAEREWLPFHVSRLDGCIRSYANGNPDICLHDSRSFIA